MGTSLNTSLLSIKHRSTCHNNIYTWPMLKFTFHDFYSSTRITIYEVHNTCRYFQQTFYFNCNVRFLQWWLLQMLSPGTCYYVVRYRWLVSKDQGRSTLLTIKNTYTRSGQLDKIWQPHFRRQLRQEPFLIYQVKFMVVALLIAWENADSVFCYQPWDQLLIG